ncbi:unnamed protein product [Lactuca virosa]|uniref:Retrotransposon Copia-like N-terminal domain-containing protein n=1 Tax=Lactuca virosa TaxID=75947 RepID=A0AAU9P3P5_9ASTR|nr:unnamed protein product [Lactuca virosa]
MSGGGANPPSPVAKIESNSPFYLGPQDRLGDFITPTKLRGDNYEDWAGDIQAALEARRKFGFLDGSITASVPPCTQSDWQTINAMLISWIMNTIDPEVKCYLSKYRDAKKLWDTLKSRFAVVNGPRIQQLKSSIAKCEQSKTMHVSEYFGKLTALWEELHRHEPLIICTCYEECTTDKAFQLVVQDERVWTAQGTVEEKPPEVLGFSIWVNMNKGRGRGGEKPDKSHLLCSHCKKTGHESSSCFELVGYLEWWEDRSKNDGGGRGGRSGGRGRSNIRANSLSVGHNSHSTVAGQAGGGNNNTSPLLFTAEQWKALTGLMSTSKIPDERLNANGATSTLELWHKQMGHPYEKVVKSLPTGQVQVNVLVYVDDVIISGNNSNAICAFKSPSPRCFTPPASSTPLTLPPPLLTPVPDMGEKKEKKDIICSKLEGVE